MSGPASLFVLLALASVHLFIGQWHWLRNPRLQHWRALAAGTALAYVFIHLLPKLAKIDFIIVQSDWRPLFSFTHNHGYLLALLGLLTFFALDQPSSERQGTHLKKHRRTMLQGVVFGLYNFQIGYLVSHTPHLSAFPLLVITVTFGLHFMAIDDHIRHHNAAIYQKLLRWVFAGSALSGWLTGHLINPSGNFLMVTTAFVAGGIIINALRNEMPPGGGKSVAVLFTSAFIAAFLILFVQYIEHE